MSSIFISYRRHDSQDIVGRIYDRLAEVFSSTSVFRDLDSIPLGVPFPQFLRASLEKTDVVLVIIGPGWLTAKDANGNRRLDDPNDFVRIEIETALQLERLIIPILVSHATLPRSDELPELLRDLPIRNALQMRPDPDFHNDIAKLIRALQKMGLQASDEDERRKAKALAQAASDVQKDVLGFLATFEHLLSTIDIVQLIKLVPQPLVPIKNVFAEMYATAFIDEANLADIADLDPQVSLKDIIEFLLQAAWDKGYFMAKFYRHNRILAPHDKLDTKTVMDHVIDQNKGIENLSVLLDVFLQRAISKCTEGRALISTLGKFPVGDRLVEIMSPHLDKWGDTVRTLFGCGVFISDVEDELLKNSG